MLVSSIEPEMWSLESRVLFQQISQDSSQRVGDDTTLFLNSKYAQFDAGWAMAGVCYLFRHLRIITNAKFKTTPAKIETLERQNTLRICINGD